jgi:hypothetical protein
MINVPPACPRGDTRMRDSTAAQAHLAHGQREYQSHCHASSNPHTIKSDTIKRKRSVVVRNGQGISQYLSQGLANPHPRSIVNGTIGARDVARPTVIRPPVIPANLPPKSDQNQLPNPFSWSAKSPSNSGGMLLAGDQPPPGAASPYTPPKLAVGAASDPVA